jgi:hypothetical protein
MRNIVKAGDNGNPEASVYPIVVRLRGERGARGKASSFPWTAR